MTGTAAGWELESKAVGSDARGIRTVHALGAWYERSSVATGIGYDAWYDPVTEELIEGVFARADIDEELVRLGAARAHAGYGRAESLADLEAFASSLPEGVADLVEAPEVRTAFLAGFETVGPGSFPRARLFGAVGDLRTRLADLYGWDPPLIPADTHALLAVAIGAEHAGGGAVHALGQLIAEHFGTAERVAWLGDGRFAVLVRRHPGLAIGIAAFEAALAGQGALEGAELRMGLEALPATRAGLAGLVRDLVDGTRPVEQASDERLALTLVDTPRAVSQVDRSTPWQRRRRRLGEAWRGGLSLVSASMVAVLVAVGLAQIVGPAADRFGTTPSTLFGPAIELVPPDAVQSTPGVALAPFSEAAGAALGEPVTEPSAQAAPVAAVEPAASAESAPGPVPTPEPQPAPAPEPAPEPEPAPAPAPQPEPAPAPQPEPTPETCSDHPVRCEHPGKGRSSNAAGPNDGADDAPGASANRGQRKGGGRA